MSLVVRLHPQPSLGQVAFWWVCAGDLDANGHAHATGAETPLVTGVDEFKFVAPPTMSEIRRHLPVIRARLASCADQLRRRVAAVTGEPDEPGGWWPLKASNPNRAASFPRWRRWQAP